MSDQLGSALFLSRRRKRTAASQSSRKKPFLVGLGLGGLSMLSAIALNDGLTAQKSKEVGRPAQLDVVKVQAAATQTSLATPQAQQASAEAAREPTSTSISLTPKQRVTQFDRTLNLEGLERGEGAEVEDALAETVTCADGWHLSLAEALALDHIQAGYFYKVSYSPSERQVVVERQRRTVYNQIMGLQTYGYSGDPLRLAWSKETGTLNPIYNPEEDPLGWFRGVGSACTAEKLYSAEIVAKS